MVLQTRNYFKFVSPFDRLDDNRGVEEEGGEERAE